MTKPSHEHISPDDSEKSQSGVPRDKVKKPTKASLPAMVIGKVVGGPAAAQRFKDLVASTLRLQE